MTPWIRSKSLSSSDSSLISRHWFFTHQSSPILHSSVVTDSSLVSRDRFEFSDSTKANFSVYFHIYVVFYLSGVLVFLFWWVWCVFVFVFVFHDFGVLLGFWSMNKMWTEMNTRSCNCFSHCVIHGTQYSIDSSLSDMSPSIAFENGF